VRTFEEIKGEIIETAALNNAAKLSGLIEEILTLRTPESQAMAFHAQGDVHEIQGDFASALESYRRALQAYEDLGDRGGAANATVCIGIVHQNTGELGLALEYYRRAIQVYEDLNHQVNIAVVTGNTGNIYTELGDYPLALEHLRRALRMHQELGDRAGVADVTGNIGAVFTSTHEYPTALEYYQQALLVHEEIGDRFGAARNAANIGLVYDHMGDYDLAMESYLSALTSFKELGNHSGASRVTGNMVATLLNSAALEGAAASDRTAALEEAAALLKVQSTMHMDDPGIRAWYLANRAKLAELSSDLEGAKVDLERALDIAVGVGQRSHEAEFNRRLRDLAQKRNDFEGYVHHNTEYSRITEEIRGKETTQRMATMEAERRMESERRERDKERALLYGALPESVANRMLAGEDVSGDHYDNVSVLFLDIAGFTTISDRIPPGQVILLLKSIFSVCDEVCRSHGLTKIKTIGDSYLAVSFPETEGRRPKTHHVESAARAAMEMQHKLNALELTMDPTVGDTSWTKDVGEIRVRIGLHCGPIVAGIVGDERLQYDVWGDTVNVASRMESTGEPGRIHVSSVFADALKGLEGTGGDSKGLGGSGLRSSGFGLRERGSVDVKGKGTMATFWLEVA
jgi:adenylate cyclase